MQHKKCSKCKKYLPIDGFSTYNDSKRGLRFRSACKECETIRDRIYKRNNREKVNSSSRIARQKRLSKLEGIGGNAYLEFMLYSRLAHFFKKSVKQGLPTPNIDAEYLTGLYNKQNGRCFYSGEEMVFNKAVKGGNSLSVDRLDPKPGYVKGNIVLCTDRINTSKLDRNLEEFKCWIKEMYNRMDTW